jgi:phage terminase small subunit
MPLTPKQEKFAVEYHKTGNASEAYRRAYNAAQMSEKAIWIEAHKMCNHPEVSLMIENLRERTRKRNEVTIDTIAAELEEARLKGLELEQISASVSASMGKAKLYGLLIEKAKIDSNVVIQVATGIIREENDD